MKKILFIAYQIPPISGAATQRHIRFLNELHKFGWEAVILTGKIRDYENYYILDRKLRGLLPGNLSVHRARNINPFEKFLNFKNKFKRVKQKQSETRNVKGRSKLTKIKDFISNFFRFPDRQNGWYLFAVIKGLKIIRTEKISAIYASGNPWTSFLVAVTLSTIFKKKLIVDFRDPWVGNTYNMQKHPLIHFMEKKIQDLIIRRANFVIANTKNMKQKFISEYPKEKRKIIHISNGFMPELFQKYLKDTYQTNSKLVISHVGTLYSNRSPKLIFEAVSEMKKEGLLSSDIFLMNFVGRTNIADVNKNTLKEYGIDDLISIIPPVSHEQALNYIAQADIALILQQGTSLQIPGKLFEYMAMKKIVFALADNGATKDIINEEKLGIVVNSDDLDGIKNALLAFLDMKKQGKLTTNQKKTNKEKYTSYTLTKKLSNLLESRL